MPVVRLLNLVDIFADTEARMKWASNKKLHLEIGVIKAIQSLNDVRISDVITALAGAGSLPQGSAPAPQQAASAPTEVKQAPQSEPEIEAKTAEPVARPNPEPQQPVVEEKINLQPEPVAEIPTPPSAPAQPEPPQEKLPPLSRKTTGETISGLDAFIDSAPEQSEAPPMIEASTGEKPAAPAKKEETPKEEEKPEASMDDDEFYQDPLIQKALVVFEATLKTA